MRFAHENKTKISSTGQKAYVQEVDSRQINTIETKQTTVIINHKNYQRCRYELKPKFNSCELESLFHVKQSRKMNQEVIHCAKSSTSIFLESLIKHLKRTIGNNQYFTI